MNTLFYFPLEIVPSRYTEQLCQKWTPEAFDRWLGDDFEVVTVEPDAETKFDGEIAVGQVLDATGRGIFSLRQVEHFLWMIRNGRVKENDVLFFQDFWTPGIEAIYYALHLHQITVRVYAMVHAQSVDEYDFTYPMRWWMRPIEQGYAAPMSGLFVASTVHKEQLREAGFNVPIHVVSLGIGFDEVSDRMPDLPMENQVIFSSRLDTEKNPWFMMEVADAFLAAHPDWRFVVTSSHPHLRSNDPLVVESLHEIAKQNNRFQIKTGLTKDQYYAELVKSRIQLNTSLQDYVSWTLLEATIAGCEIVYPDFRSFVECVPSVRRYKPFEVDSAIEVMERAMREQMSFAWIALLSSEVGRKKQVDVLAGRVVDEVNVWEQAEQWENS